MQMTNRFYRSRSVFFSSQVFDGWRAILKGIILQRDSLSLPADTNTYILILACCIFKSCVSNGDVSGFSLDIDADPLLFRTIVTNDTILDPVSAAAAKFICLLTKQYSNLAVAFNCTLPDNIVRVTMSNTDSVPAVLG